jgi:hypothetical protein
MYFLYTSLGAPAHATKSLAQIAFSIGNSRRLALLLTSKNPSLDSERSADSYAAMLLLTPPNRYRVESL